MRRRRNPVDVSPSDILIVGGVAAAVYIIYQIVNKAPQALKTVTAPVSTVIASLWSKLTLAPAQVGVLGDVVLADGSDIGPLANFQIRTDAQGNVYVNSGGAVYQLGQSDSNGNWPASLMLDPDFGVTGTGW